MSQSPDGGLVGRSLLTWSVAPGARYANAEHISLNFMRTFSVRHRTAVCGRAYATRSCLKSVAEWSMRCKRVHPPRIARPLPCRHGPRRGDHRPPLTHLFLPLSQERGQDTFSHHLLLLSEERGQVTLCRLFLPLPVGEGRGEGEIPKRAQAAQWQFTQARQAHLTG